MLTRGIIIGKIVDDLAGLKYQIETRNRLGQFDLTKFCEDFCREILNITYNYNLVNLNKARSNNPGLDLGDEKNKVAFQITSQRSSAKVEDTLKAIDPIQEEAYKKILIFIIGDKQSSYSLDDPLCKKFNFNKNTDILDIDSFLRDVVILDIERLETLHNLFIREFRQVKIELEPVDEKGNFESSYFNSLEKKPSSPPKNAYKFLGGPIKGYEREKERLNELYENLASIPRVTREILAIIVERGKYGPSYNIKNKYGILSQTLERIMRLTQDELIIEINILEDAGLISVEEDEVGGRKNHYLVTSGTQLNSLFFWLIDEKLSVKVLLNTMDFTILDA